jgi:hypothetical protein
MQEQEKPAPVSCSCFCPAGNVQGLDRRLSAQEVFIVNVPQERKGINQSPLIP